MGQKNEFLFERGVNFNDLPNWQKRGIGIYWETYKKQGINPQTGEKVLAKKQRIKVDMNLPMKDDYSSFIKMFLKDLEVEK